MAITIDPANRRLILDSAAVTAKDIFRAWSDWALLSDNLKYLPAFSATGGDDLGAGLSIPPYYFLENSWRVRPMESAHNLTITGNLFVQGGGVPVVSTLGTYQVNVNYTVPVQAQGISTSGSTGPTAADIADAVRAELAAELLRVIELAKIHGLVQGAPLTVTPASRSAGGVDQAITGDGTTTSTVTRV